MKYLKSTPPATANSPSTTTISPELKAKMCDPSNPSLKVVNTTESHICGIPKAVKNTTTTAATPPPSPPSLPPANITTNRPPSLAPSPPASNATGKSPFDILGG